MCSFDHCLLNLLVIGTDQDAAIYNGFSMDNPELKLLLCVYHLEKCDRHKWSQLHPKKGASKKILADIYGCRYESFKELGLADFSMIKDFDSNLDNVKGQWEQLCFGFYEWFVAKWKTLFQEKVTEEARKALNVYGLYYNNNIQSMQLQCRAVSQTGIISKRNQYSEEDHQKTAR